jgi:putative hemolysin
MWTVELVVMGAMIALNSVFAAYEIALASIGLARLDTLVKDHRAGAESALRMKQSMEASLAVVQLGITLVGAVAAATGGAGAEETIEPLLLSAGLSDTPAQLLSIAIVVVPLTVVTIIVGELVPKVFALRNREWVVLRLSRAMEWFAYSVWPAVWFFETSVSVIMNWGESRWSSESDSSGHSGATELQELRTIAALARASRLIGRREEAIIVSAARLARTQLRSIMLPVQHISTLALDDTLVDALVAAHHDMHTRFPVTRVPGDCSQIVGYVNLKDIVSTMRLSPDEPSLAGIVRSMPTFDADLSVASCLEQLIRHHNHIALVRSADGQIEGMVTLEDILEELVGEIEDEYDRIPAHITAAGAGWIVGGSATLAQVQNTTGIHLPTEKDPTAKTLNEWVIAQLGRPARGGDQLGVDGVRVLVRKVRRNLVQEAQVMRSTRDAPQPTAAH